MPFFILSQHYRMPELKYEKYLKSSFCTYDEAKRAE
jgi:hypothetical protein